MYPHGAANCGALDMAGNLWEWCLNNHNNPEIVDSYSNEKSKVLRGGSFNSLQSDAAASYRHYDHPLYRNRNYGLRLAACPISAL
jgi:formylglycine-generating enzyme required for sulfatase activity